MKVNLQKERVRRLLNEWKEPLYLGDWEVNLRFFRKRKLFRHEDGTEAIFRTDVFWQYKSACIKVNLACVAEQDDKSLGRYFVHELAHIILGEMQAQRAAEDFIMHLERTTTTLAEIFWWLKRELSA